MAASIKSVKNRHYNAKSKIADIDNQRLTEQKTATPPKWLKLFQIFEKLGLAVFSDPEFASVGATEVELDTAGIPFFTATYPFNDHGKSMLMGETHGFVKLTASRISGEILGGAVVGPHASELIHEIVVAMRYRATVAEFSAIPHYHPTLSEIWTYPAEDIAEQIATAR